MIMNSIKLQYLAHFNNFVSQLKVIFPSDETVKVLETIESWTDEVKLARGQLFNSSIRDENFDSFLKNKIKVFSHKADDTRKISETLFGADFSVKNLLNNQPEEVKKFIWLNLHTLWIIGEMLKPEELIDNEKINQMNEILLKERGIEESNEPEQNNESTNTESSEKSNKSGNKVTNKKLQDMLGVNVNSETTQMIDDIVGSFESVLTNKSGSGNPNPLAGIMEISQKISVKYADKINKGEIELDKLMESITKKVPGMDQMMAGMGGMGGQKKKPKEKILMDENFSTANIQVGINKEPEGNKFNIGNMLKMADQFGVIPGGKKSESGDMPGMPGMAGMDGIPGIGKVMELMQKLDKTETNEEAEALKLEMDTFLQKELGVDVEQLNAQLDTVTKQMSESVANSNTNDDVEQNETKPTH